MVSNRETQAAVMNALHSLRKDCLNEKHSKVYTIAWLSALTSVEAALTDVFNTLGTDGNQREAASHKSTKNAAACPVDMNDPVNHPAHYTDGIEVIDYIESKLFPYHLGNAVKYLSRAGKKDPAKTVEDLEKAIWYIRRYILFLEKQRMAKGEGR